jgi:hypothetical protein
MDMEDKRKHIGGSHLRTEQQQENIAPAAPRPYCAPARADGGPPGAATRDAALSNTASHKCNQDYFQALRWGIDSLYLNYPGSVLPEVDDRLKALKKFAQSPEANDHGQAQYQICEHIFEVKDKAPKGFAYVLEDGAFRVQISRSSLLPCAYVKVSSTYLAHVGPKRAEEAARRIVDTLIDVRQGPAVSRIDLFVDFASWEDMEWNREAWVTRASSVDSYAEELIFTGWVIGKGSIISARLYHKLVQATKIKATYLFDLWRTAGWDGQTPVWRLEFQLRRELLTQHGLRTLPAVLDNLNGLWGYATAEWLRLTIPSAEDKTRSRWPIHPLWGYLSSIDWETDGAPLSRTYSPARVPKDDYLFSRALSVLVAFMAREGITGLEHGQKAFIGGLQDYYSEKARRMGQGLGDYIAEKLSVKTRQFNTLLNNPDFNAKLHGEEVERKARAYRQQSRGGA